jgi:ABC-2 type transport system permease protein
MTSLAGTGALIRLLLRRDRILLPIWIVFTAIAQVGVVASFAKLYPTAEALRGFADQCMSNPAIVAMLGPVLAPTLGGLAAWRTGPTGMIICGLPSLLFVIRHTRAEEEAGQRELLGATVVGRHAVLSATLIVTLAGNLVISGLIAAGLIGQGLPIAGSIALGLSWAAAGWIFAAVAALAAQLSESSTTARSIALAVFGLFFMIRFVGDSRGENSELSPISWLSPLGWTRLTRPFAGEQWWVFALATGFVVVLTTAAYALSSRRDLGAGLLPQRLGPPTASPGLRSALALGWRLQRGMLIGWSIAFALIGFLLGAVGQTASTVTNTPQFHNWLVSMGAHDSPHAFLRVIVYVLGETISAYAILAALRLRSEEVEMRAEPLLATSLSRLRWVASHLIFACTGPAIALFVAGVAIGLIYGISSGDVGRELPPMLATTIKTLPAVWVMAGIAVALFGLLPRLATFVSWGTLAVFLILELGWELRQISQSVFDISPFAHVHWAAEVTAANLVALIGVAAMLTVLGLIGFRARDLG